MWLFSRPSNRRRGSATNNKGNMVNTSVFIMVTAGRYSWPQSSKAKCFICKCNGNFKIFSWSCLSEMKTPYLMLLSVLSSIAFWVKSWLWPEVLCTDPTGWNFIHSRSVELSDCEELLSNNAALPVGKMIIKQQIFKSILELFYEMQLGQAVRHYHGSFVVLCHRLRLKEVEGFFP